MPITPAAISISTTIGKNGNTWTRQDIPGRAIKSYTYMEKKYILTPEKAMMKLRRMAFEILERNNGATAVSIAGIKENGFVVAQELKAILGDISSLQIDLIEIQIDKSNPINCAIPNGIELKDKILIVVDDVVNSGKTLLYAILPFLPLSPKQIQGRPLL